MEPLRMAKHMIDFNEATVDNPFNGMVLLQGQTERITKTFTEQATPLSEGGEMTRLHPSMTSSKKVAKV